MKNLLLIFSLIILYSSTIEAQYPTLLKDINTVGNSGPYGYCKVNNVIYFSHDDEVHGYELWRTDGTAIGTYLVKDVNTGFIGSFVRNMVEFNDNLYFAAYTNGLGYITPEISYRNIRQHRCSRSCAIRFPYFIAVSTISGGEQ